MNPSTNAWKGTGSCQILSLAWDAESALIPRFGRFAAALTTSVFLFGRIFLKYIFKMNKKVSLINIYIITDETEP